MKIVFLHVRVDGPNVAAGQQRGFVGRHHANLAAAPGTEPTGKESAAPDKPSFVLFNSYGRADGFQNFASLGPAALVSSGRACL